MFVKKLLNFRAVVFFVFILGGIFSNIQYSRAAFECVFDTAKQAQVESYCSDEKMNDAVFKVKSLYPNCDATPDLKMPISEGAEPYIWFNDCPGPISTALVKHWQVGGSYDLQRALCGWNDINTDMFGGNNIDKNWASCQFKNNKCIVAEGSKEEICNTFDKITCALPSTAKQHGCKVQSAEKNGCYCNSQSNPSVLEYYASQDLKDMNLKTNPAHCADVPFSNTDGITKCIWYVNNIPDPNGTGIKNSAAIGEGDGCSCTDLKPPNTNYFRSWLLYQDQCLGAPQANAGTGKWEFSQCTWSENGTVLGTSEANNLEKNGCYCFGNIYKISIGDTFTTQNGGVKDTTPLGKEQDLCINQVQFGATSTCMWVVNSKVVAVKSGEGKKGCFCRTKDNPNVSLVQWPISTSQEVCIAGAHQQEMISCDWWENNQLVTSTVNYEAKAAAAKTETTTPSTPGITVDELKNLASKNLNPMQFAVGKQGVLDLLGRIVKALMYAMGSILFALYIYAGILWMTSSGSSEKVGMAKKIVVWSTLGVIVQLSAYMIVNIVFKFTGSN